MVFIFSVLSPISAFNRTFQLHILIFMHYVENNFWDRIFLFRIAFKSGILTKHGSLHIPGCREYGSEK